MTPPARRLGKPPAAWASITVVTVVVAVLVSWAILGWVGSGPREGSTSGDASAQGPVRPGMPSAASTGVPAGTALDTVAGELRVTTPGERLDALDIGGSVVIAAPDVVITRSRVHGNGSGAYGIFVESGSVTIADSEISGFANGIAQDNWSAYRVDIHQMSEDGVKLGNDVVLADSYIHDLTPGPGAHSDGAQMQSAVTHLVVRGNVIDVSGGAGAESMNSALFLKPDFGPSSPGPVAIIGNYLNGGGYALYCVPGGEAGFVVGSIRIADNRFGRDFGYGPADVSAPITEEGNVWDDTGERLRL